MTNNRGGNDGSEKLIKKKNTAATVALFKCEDQRYFQTQNLLGIGTLKQYTAWSTPDLLPSYINRINRRDVN